MRLILDKSDNGRLIKSFRTLSWKSSNNQADSNTATFWSTNTNFHLNKFVQYLQMKKLLSLTNAVEERALYDAPGVLEDNLFISALRAERTGINMELLFHRISMVQNYLGLKTWNQNLFYTWNGDVKYEMFEIRQTIRKVNKFSGYVRSISAIGKGNLGSSRVEPEIFEWSPLEEIDWYQFLTVGELTLGTPGSAFFTLMSPNKDETEIVTKLVR